jgi:hypothetical protein
MEAEADAPSKDLNSIPEAEIIEKSSKKTSKNKKKSKKQRRRT